MTYTRALREGIHDFAIQYFDEKEFHLDPEERNPVWTRMCQNPCWVDLSSGINTSHVVGAFLWRMFCDGLLGQYLWARGHGKEIVNLQELVSYSKLYKDCSSLFQKPR